MQHAKVELTTVKKVTNLTLSDRDSASVMTQSEPRSQIATELFTAKIQGTLVHVNPTLERGVLIMQIYLKIETLIAIILTE